MASIQELLFPIPGWFPSLDTMRIQEPPGAGVASYHHVDVFSSAAYSGNSLAVFVDPPDLTAAQMAAITRELRHFETIFVARGHDGGARAAVTARVFDLFEELDFAGHPVLGAAAVLHELTGAPAGARRDWTFALPARTAEVTTCRHPAGNVAAVLDVGGPQLTGQPPPGDAPAIAAALGLARSDLDATLPPQVWSAGLRYLLVPVRGAEALAAARIAPPGIAGFLGERGAQFCYLLDAAGLEGRHWNNDGVVEDVATGSAAGCVGAYLLHHGLARDGEEVGLSQGRFTGRPSTIKITAYGGAGDVARVTVGGDVSVVGSGWLRALPAPVPV
jgi:PhzF family phenazine biosynthesis protein